MARRRTKKRTHNLHKPKAPTGDQPIHATMKDKIPKSMVLRIGAGEVGPSISQLVLDTRKMMEPHTAIRLKERKSNKLRDYTTMAGPLGVTQLLLFSRNPSSGSTTLRIARCPRGPTLHFRIKKYSLCKDIRRSMKRPKTPTGKEYLTPPLLVMNNFTSTTTPGERSKPHEALIISMFQSLFPPLSAQHTPLNSIRRVLLLNRIPKAAAASLPESERSDSDYLIDLRHYSITTKPLGLSKALKRLSAAEKVIASSSTSKPKGGKGTVPNLGKLADISEYMLDPSLAASGYTSESEIDDDAEVEVLPGSTSSKNPTKGKRNMNTTGAAGGAEKHAVKLTEIGPRMTLELVKIEEGLADGKVLYHSFVSKTKKEEKELEERWKEKNKLREKRRKEQEENVKRKKVEVEAKKKRRDKGVKGDEGDEGAEGSKEEDGSDEDEIIDYVKSGDESGESEDEGQWDDEDEDEDGDENRMNEEED